MSLSGSHQELSLADLIQIGAANRRTFRARIRGDHARGECYLAGGELVHATYGELAGPDAMYAMLSDPSVTYELQAGVIAGVRTVHASAQQVLLEAARRQDEGLLPRPISASQAVQVVTPLMFTVKRLLYVGLGAVMAGAVFLSLWWVLAGPSRPEANLQATRAAIPAAAPGGVAAAAIPPLPRPAANAAAVGATAVDAATLTGAGDAPPTYLSGPAPRAPGVDLALAPTIVLRLLVDEAGRVLEARVYRSRLELAAFEEAALAITSELRFQPARRAGQPVAAWLNWPVSFAQTTAPAATTLHLKGSDTIGGALGPDLARSFTATGETHTQVTVEALGSATAFVGLFDGSADIGASSRPVNDKELEEARRLGVSLEELVIGYDGIAVVVNPKNHLGQLTIEQAARLFTGEIDNWSQLGGPDAPVHIYSRPGYSGTHSFFKEKVLRRGNAKGPEEFAASTVFVEETGELVKRVAADPDAVGYAGLGWVDDSVHALALSPGAGHVAIAASAQTVRDGTYPVYRPLLMYTRGAPRGQVAAFLRFVLSPAGQELVAKHGFIKSDTPADALVPMGSENQPATSANRAAGPTLRLSFRAASWRLDAAGVDGLHDLATRLAQSGERVLVVGHADAEGSSASNEKVSLWRAQAVAAVLHHFGVATDHLQVEAAGSDRPLATNQTGAGRDRNRRVEVFVLAR
jgi:phosphate transport system substrate-binding protein